MHFTNFIWSWAREADKSAVSAAPTGWLGTTVGPDLSRASPIYRPANDLIHFLTRIITSLQYSKFLLGDMPW
jgi:hypothetical protein